MTLNGKTCLVTGAAGGIGGAVAKRLAQQGAKVAVCDFNEEGAVEMTNAIVMASGIAKAFCGDVALAESVEKMFGQAAESLGPMDVLVNSAGISKIRPFLETTEQQWDQTIRVNLKSVYLTCKAVLPAMVNRQSGIIVNISSQSGKRGAAWYADYCVSKFAIIDPEPGAGIFPARHSRQCRVSRNYPDRTMGRCDMVRLCAQEESRSRQSERSHTGWHPPGTVRDAGRCRERGIVSGKRPKRIYNGPGAQYHWIVKDLSK